MEQLEQYLKPTFTIDSDNRLIRQKAHELAVDGEDAAEKARRLFYFVRDQIKFTMYVKITSEEDYLASATLDRGEGYCVQKAVLMTALARASAIPARLAFADIANNMLPRKYVEMQGTNIMVFHGFAELHLNGRWTTLTPAFDIAHCEQHGIIPVDFDGVHDAVLHPLDQRGKPHIEYVRYHGSFQDLPHTSIMNATKDTYGQEFFNIWTAAAKAGRPPSG